MVDTVETLEGVSPRELPLDDLMAAMDVVDTLRHQQGVAARELDGQGRRERLLARLQELYHAQGIEVPDHVLQQGIDALEQERFQYQPVSPSFATKMAHIWVSRQRWSKPLGFLAVLGSLFGGIYFVTDVLPEKQLRDALPNQLRASLSTIRIIAKNPDVVSDAEHRSQIGLQAIQREEYEQAGSNLEYLRSVAQLLQLEYTIRVVSRPNQSSGVWRVPDVNESGRNYYLIVEAIDPDNQVLQIEVINEETNVMSKTSAWGLRVSEATFYKIKGDKEDDGIVQSNHIGKKEIGYLKPSYSIATTGSTITEW